ncbi:alpha/beta fold hydrolase [Ekhidna sp.]|uniref:alpha/beta fold hydrolase n=1 Tax=Ekhidna sp. TaxID=2608089 RepID=UPI003B5BD8CD
MKQLILIHGAIGAADQMIPLRELLKDEFEVHILELEGHGSGSHLSDAFSTSKFISELTALISRIGAPVHIFGYSMGGFIALLSAANGNSQIRSITTLGTKMKWSPQIAEQEVRHLNPEKIREKVPAFASALEKRHGSYWEEVLRRTVGYMKILGEEAPITKERMSQINIPVQLCLADQDQMVSNEETEEVLNWLPDSRIQSIAESKHPIEQTDLIALAETIRSFINAVD